MNELPNDFADLVLETLPENYNPWFSVTVKQPEGAPIVLMYCESNNSFYLDHFVLTLPMTGAKVTHWQPLIGPKDLGQ